MISTRIEFEKISKLLIKAALKSAVGAIKVAVVVIAIAALVIAGVMIAADVKLIKKCRSEENQARHIFGSVMYNISPIGILDNFGVDVGGQRERWAQAFDT